MTKILNYQTEIENLNQTLVNSFNTDRNLDLVNYADLMSHGYNFFTGEFDPDISDDDLETALRILAINEHRDSDSNADDFDILDDQQMDKLLADTFNDGALQVKRISVESNLYQWLRSWYHQNDYQDNFKTYIRSYYEDDYYLYYLTGVGYATEDADLLGGNGDGTTEQLFYDWLNQSKALDQTKLNKLTKKYTTKTNNPESTNGAF